MTNCYGQPEPVTDTMDMMKRNILPVIVILLSIALTSACAGRTGLSPDLDSAKPDPQAAEQQPEDESPYIAYVREMSLIDRNYKAYYHYSLAQWMIAKGDAVEALRQYEKARTYAVPEEFPHLELVELRLMLGDYRGALTELDTALRVDPQNPRAWLAKAGLMEATGDFDGALQAYDKCSEIDPQMTECRLFKANLLVQTGDFEEAFDLMEGVLKQQPDFYQARLMLARVCLQSGRNQRAQQEFARVLEGDPYSIEAILGLGVLAEQDGRSEEALEYYTQALDLDPGNSAVRDRVISLLLALDRHEEALQEADRIKTIDADEQAWKMTRGLMVVTSVPSGSFTIVNS